MKEMTLFDPGPQAPQELTEHQAAAFEHVRQAGRDGITATELGRALGMFHLYQRSTGNQMLQALKRKGWVRQTRSGYVAIDQPQPETTDTDPFPEGF